MLVFIDIGHEFLPRLELKSLMRTSTFILADLTAASRQTAPPVGERATGYSGNREPWFSPVDEAYKTKSSARGLPEPYDCGLIMLAQRALEGAHAVTAAVVHDRNEPHLAAAARALRRWDKLCL